MLLLFFFFFCEAFAAFTQRVTLPFYLLSFLVVNLEQNRNGTFGFSFTNVTALAIVMICSLLS